MKRILLALMAFQLCMACNKEMEENIGKQQEEINVLKTEVEGFEADLLAAERDLDGLITALNVRVTLLETEIAALKNAGDSSEDTSSGGTDTSTNDSMLGLEVQERIETLQCELADAQSTLAELESSLSEVRNSVETISSTMSTYATEDELNTLETEVNSLAYSVSTLINECATKFGLIQTDLETIRQTLQTLNDADENLDKLISTLKERAATIETSISFLESSVEDDVDELNAKITALNNDLTAVNNAIAELKEKDKTTDAAILSLQTTLDTHISESKTAFTQNTDALNVLTEQIATMKTQYEEEFDLIKKDIADIVSIIQSMTPISEWNNGDVSARRYTDYSNEEDNSAIVEFNYIVRPAGTAAKLVQAWAENKDLMQFRAHYTLTRASFDFVDMEVMDVSASDDILTVVGYVAGISDKWINEQESFSVSLLVTDGKTDYCTAFVNICPDLEGTDLSAGETANCYMVHEAGYYRFKIHKGTAPHSAEVVWESLGSKNVPDVGCLIEPEPVICNNFVYFKTNDTWNDGNALIAVKNAAGEIVWSWHLWLTGDSPQERAYNNNAGTIMGRNLGGFDRYGFQDGLLYQHGRKDPFLGYSGVTYEFTAKSTIEWPDPVKSDETTGTYAYAVQNPTVFITKNDLNGHWKYTGTEYLPRNTDFIGGVWSGGDTKSANDPCPPGWRIPKGNVQTSTGINCYSIWSDAYNSDFTVTRDKIDVNGLFCYDKFGGNAMSNIGDYFFSGYLSEDTGEIDDGGELGYYWASSPFNADGYNCLHVDWGGNVKHLSTSISGARAVSVRCVKM